MVQRIVLVIIVTSPRWTSGSPRMLLELICEFESRRGEIMSLSAKIKKDQLLRAPSVGSTIRRASTREERAEIFSR